LLLKLKSFNTQYEFVEKKSFLAILIITGWQKKTFQICITYK